MKKYTVLEYVGIVDGKHVHLIEDGEGDKTKIDLMSDIINFKQDNNGQPRWGDDSNWEVTMCSELIGKEIEIKNISLGISTSVGGGRIL